MQNVIEISARQSGKTEAMMTYIRYALQCHEKIAIGSNDVDTLHDRVKAIFPKAKLTKCDGFLLVENE